MVKNHKIYTGNFDNRLSTIKFWYFGVENVPNYSCFGYWLSRYIFPKKLKIPKLLPERITLVYMGPRLKGIIYVEDAFI